MAIQLKQAGIHDFVILEKGSGVGGTWRHNTYPGLSCDVRSHLYSFSFEPKRDWTRPYPDQPEILAYLEQVAAKHAIEPHLRLGTEVRSARWDESRATWELLTAAGARFEAHVVVSAMGMFNELHWPDIPGLREFRGTLFVLHQMQRMQAQRIAWMDVRREALDVYDTQIQEELAGIEVWQVACHNYYRAGSGRIVTQWPNTMGEYRRRCSSSPPDAYDVGYAEPPPLS
jgi:hypothetical protein